MSYYSIYFIYCSTRTSSTLVEFVDVFSTNIKHKTTHLGNANAVKKLAWNQVLQTNNAVPACSKSNIYNVTLVATRLISRVWSIIIIVVLLMVFFICLRCNLVKYFSKEVFIPRLNMFHYTDNLAFIVILILHI